MEASARRGPAIRGALGRASELCSGPCRTQRRDPLYRRRASRDAAVGPSEQILGLGRLPGAVAALTRRKASRSSSVCWSRSQRTSSTRSNTCTSTRTRLRSPCPGPRRPPRPLSPGAAVQLRCWAAVEVPAGAVRPCRTIYNMCTQKPPHDYSEQLYGKYREAFNKYINDKVYNCCSRARFGPRKLGRRRGGVQGASKRLLHVSAHAPPARHANNRHPRPNPDN
jgi:hypothetical protein